MDESRIPPVKIHDGEVNRMFEKQFQYVKSNSEEWNLPQHSSLFGEFYQFGCLQEMKYNLNNTKSKLNNYIIEEWSAHTQRKDPAGEIPWFIKNDIKAEFVTVAWCKLFECLHRFPLVNGPQFNSLHLCEAPGAFISALNHYIHTTYSKEEIKWQWFATTLNPYYEGNQLGRMIVDDRFMLHTLDRWLFHNDFTGDIMSRKNIQQMQKQCAQRCQQIDLITADGSIDCVSTPAEQEEVVASLHYAEIVAALSILAEGGNFVLKKFTLFEAASVCVMYLLNCIFAEVHVCKPCTSRRGNSEVYVVCLGYKPQTNNLQKILALMMLKLEEGNVVVPLFAKAQLPQSFLVQHFECAELFMNYQIEAIESNILSFEYKTDRYQARRSHTLRTIVRKEFVQRYNVQPLPEDQKILYSFTGGMQNAVKCFFYKGSYAERESFKTNGLEAQVYILQRRLNEMEKSLKSSVSAFVKVEQDSNPFELYLYRGLPYKTLNSSLFAAPPVMLFCQNIAQTTRRHPLAELKAKCVINEIELCFQCNDSNEGYYGRQLDFFQRLINSILDGQEPDVISFHDFPFLTHFSVSILRYLALVAFHEVGISTEDDEFVVSVRKNEKLNESQVQALLNLRELLSHKPACVLSVLHIKQLHRNELTQVLMEFNNLLLLKKCKDILNSFYAT